MDILKKIKSYRAEGYCPCCGYRIFREETISTYDICPICFWEDESLVKKSIDEAYGPNHVSLTQAQRNFLDFGAKEKKTEENTREPKEDEIQHPEWPWLAEE